MMNISEHLLFAAIVTGSLETIACREHFFTISGDLINIINKQPA